MLKRSCAFIALALAAALASSCDLFDVDKERELSVTIFENISSMDVRDYVTMTISVPGSEDKQVAIHYNPNLMVVGNPPYGGVDDYDVVYISWFGKEEVTITVKVGDTSADITVSEDEYWFLYEYPSTISQ